MRPGGRNCGWRAACCLVSLLWIGSCGAHSKEAVKSEGIETVSSESLLEQGLLPIPPRLQWSNDHGYCGETSLQSIALYYGAWISQRVARQAGGGELLLGHIAEKAIAALHFELESFPFAKNELNFEKFMLWLKGNLARKVPAIITVYLNGVEHEADDSYDHIVPVIGFKPHEVGNSQFDREDVLVFHNNFNAKPIFRSFGSLMGSRDGCQSDLDGGGCIARHEIYALVIRGIIDRDRTSLPVRMSVANWDEPNISQGESPMPMIAALTISGLARGRSYALLRYNDPAHVPLAGGGRDFLSSKYQIRHDFTAEEGEYIYRDPTPFLSSESVYYRCVAIP